VDAVSVDAVSVDAVSVDAGIWSQRVFMAELVAPRLFPEKLVNLPSGTQKRIKWRMLKIVEHGDVTLHELGGFDHGGMAAPAFPLLVKFVARVTQKLP